MAAHIKYPCSWCHPSDIVCIQEICDTHIVHTHCTQQEKIVNCNCLFCNYHYKFYMYVLLLIFVLQQKVMLYFSGQYIFQ